MSTDQGHETPLELTPPDDAASVEQGLMAFIVEPDFECVYVATSKAEAMRAALVDWGGDAAEYWPEGESDIDFIPNLDLPQVLDDDEDGNPIPDRMRSFRAEIQRRIAEGETPPFFLCAKDW